MGSVEAVNAPSTRIELLLEEMDGKLALLVEDVHDVLLEEKRLLFKMSCRIDLATQRRPLLVDLARLLQFSNKSAKTIPVIVVAVD